MTNAPNKSTACEGCSHPGICEIHGCAADSVQARRAVLQTTDLLGNKADPTKVCGIQQTTSHLDQIDYDCAVCGYSITIQATERLPPECGKPIMAAPIKT